MYHNTMLLAASLAVMLVTGSASSLPHNPDRTLQSATPAITFPMTPDPAQCTIEPRTVSSVLALLGTPSATLGPVDGTPASAASTVIIPVGLPANPDIETSISATVYELQACFNAGDFRRAFALVTDDFLRDFAEKGSLTAQDIAFFVAEPTPTPIEDRPLLLAVTDVSVLRGGRVGAFVVTDSPFTGPDTVYMIFTQQGDRWLVDEIVEFL